MKYNEKLCSIGNSLNDNNKSHKFDKNIKSIQRQLLKIIMQKLKLELVNSKNTPNELIKIKFKEQFFSNPDDGYNQIANLINSNAFDSFFREYCIYLGNTETQCDEFHTAYFELIWDYKTYLQLSENEHRRKINYSIEKMMEEEENGAYKTAIIIENAPNPIQTEEKYQKLFKSIK